MGFVIRSVVRVVQGLVAFLFGALAMGFLLMWVWNAVVPDVLHLQTITYWQSVLLLVLAHILFRGAGVRVGWRDNKWKSKFRGRIASMSPEEREKFHAEWQRRCGCHDGGEEEKGTAHE